MAVDMFMKIEGIPGCFEDNEHKGEHDILAWSWGMSQTEPCMGAAVAVRAKPRSRI